MSLVAALALGSLSISIFSEAGIGTPAIASAIGAALFLGCPWLLRATGSLVISGNVMMAVLFAVMALSSLRTGGIGLPASFAAGTLPLTAALLAGRRSGAVWAVVACAGLLGLHAMHVNGYVFAEAPSLEAAYQRQFHGALAIVFVLGANAVLYEWLKGGSVDALAERNLSLERTSRDLRESRARSDAILESAGEGIYGIDLDGRATFVNPAALQLMGRDEAELIGHAMHSICHHGRPDGSPYPADECPIYATLRDGAVHKVRNEVFWRRDGSSFPVEYLSAPMRDGQGTVVGAVVTFQDSSQQARIAEMGEILNSSLNEIYVFHADTLRFVHANAGALANLQYSLDELSGLTPMDLKPELSAHDFAERVEPLRTRAEDTIKFTTVHRRKDGSLYPVEVHLQLSTFGSEPVFLAIILDISQRRLLEAQLVQAQKLESIGQLAAGVAHEINTPIQFVGDNIGFLQDAFDDLASLEKAYASLLDAARAGNATPELVKETEERVADADRDYLVEEIPRAIAQAREGVERVAKIVAAMKEFSHPGGGDTRERTDLKSAIESTVTVASSEWKYAADIVTEFAEDMPAVPCFRQELNQVVLVLIVNAAHAIAAAGGSETEKGAITVATLHGDGFAEIRVTDTGTGIPEAIREKVFDPFFTTKEVGRGTGQGLAISYRAITEKHGGTLSFETEVGEGTTFIIRLPLD